MLVASIRALQFGHDPEVVESGRRDAAVRRLASFNSATTRRSWKAARSQLAPRPRAAGFNSATTRRSWKARARQGAREGVRGLQFGHDPEVVESWKGLSCLSPCGAASIRPRPGGRGKTASSARPSSTYSASIRPRPGGRGKSSSRGERVCCGDRFNSATTRRSWKARCRAPFARGRRCFNSATTRRSWKGVSAAGVLTAAALLQFGHDPEVVERAARGREPGGGTGRFNSATTRRSWKGARPCGAPRTKPRFNSATTRRSWKVCVRHHSPSCSSVLQFGHDPEVVERTRGRRCVPSA